MIVVCNHIPIDSRYSANFEEGFANRAGLVDTMAGFISFQLLRPQKEGDSYIVMTVWDSESAFKAWTKSPEFREGHARLATLPPQFFTGQTKLELYEIIQSTVNMETTQG